MPTYPLHEQVQITRHILRVLDEWGLSGKEIIRVLALPTSTRLHHLERFRDGASLPATQEIIQRIEYIAGIADALRTSFPRNANMSIVWMRTPNKRFQNQTPLHVLTERGLSGLRVVRAELDCAFAWDESRTN